MIHFQGENLHPEEGETVLDCILRHGIDTPYSCKSGLCQTCMMRAIKGTPTAQSQKPLKPVQQSQGYFLACACVPQGDMDIIAPDAQAFQFHSHVIEKSWLATDILRLQLARPDNFQYHAGQYLTIYKNARVGRCYSLASIPGTDRHLEFHVRVFDDGEVSAWMAKDLNIGDTLVIGEALGNCVYASQFADSDLLLIGSGTGLAPLYGILRQAISDQHRGNIHLYHGSRLNAGIYLHEQLSMLTHDHANLHYRACVSGEQPDTRFISGRATDIALKENTDLKNRQVYICGNAAMVNATKQKVFLAGASLKAIHADPFVHAH